MADTITDERNALLDELSSALDTWYEKEVEAINAEIELVKSVVQSRSSATGSVKSNTAAARVLVINDISSFLAGTG